MIQKVSEDIHYELVPDDEGNQQGWNIRILEGDFVETVIRLGNVAFNGETDCLNFNFAIVSTPDRDLNEDSVDLQEYVGLILESVLENAIAEGNVQIGEPKVDDEED